APARARLRRAANAGGAALMSGTVSLFIAIFSVLNVIACGWLIWWTAPRRPNEVDKGEVIDHVWDGDLQERNNPMPRWWLMLFYISIVFCFVYFLLYPGLGRFGGVLAGTGTGQYDAEIAHANDRYGQMYAAFAGREVPDLAQDPKALALGHSLFVNNCTTCHGSDGRPPPGHEGPPPRSHPLREQLHDLPRLRRPRRRGLPQPRRRRLALRRRSGN